MSPTRIVDLMGLSEGVLLPGASPGVGDRGRAVSFDGAFGGGAINFGSSARLKSPSFTWTGLFNIASFSAAYCPIFYWSSPTDAYTLFVKSGGKLACYCTRAGAGTFYDGIGANTIQTGVTYRLTLCSSENGPFRAYVNGVFDGQTNSAMGAFEDTSGDVFINNVPPNPNEKWAGWGSDFAYFPRELSASEIARLNNRPYSLFRPTTRRILVGVPSLSGAGVIDITSTSARPRVSLTF
ncbi:MAG: hypothetical protein IOD11_18835 [Rhodocyclaceae bacterium]|nr:hypothetical protein [Rhodocyclaceae bacterium]